MAEAGVDLRGQSSKSLAALGGAPVDILITVCDQARDACPHYAGAASTRHWSLPDPARAQGTPEEVLVVFRRSRDDIRQRVESLLQELG